MKHCIQRHTASRLSPAPALCATVQVEWLRMLKVVLAAVLHLPAAPLHSPLCQTPPVPSVHSPPSLQPSRPLPLRSAKAPVANMEFVQFHPTSLYAPACPGYGAGGAGALPGRSFLITEAVRGEGGMLFNLGE